MIEPTVNHKPRWYHVAAAWLVVFVIAFFLVIGTGRIIAGLPS